MVHGPGRSLVLFLLLLAASAAARAAEPSQPKPSSGPPYAASKSCGACHEAMYKAWSDSVHARAATSPAYLEAVRRTVEQSSDKKAAREGCTWCHAPTTIVTGDFELQEPISREGITCDFCHTIADVDLSRVPPFETEPGPVKRGPLGYTRVQGHEAAYSSLHRFSPLLCASCHEFKNAHGVSVLSNYSEWKDGPYPARGVSCQGCHMALVPGTPTGIAGPGASQRVVNLHRLVGGSAISQLARGLDLKFESVTTSDGSAEVVVTVTNAAAGHSIPGGLATKSLVLAVGAETAEGKLEYRQERIYRRELRDGNGVALATVSDMFLKSASVGADTRIKPLESRRERFAIPLPAGGRAIVARLEYRDASDAGKPAINSLIVEVKHPLDARTAVPSHSLEGPRSGR